MVHYNVDLISFRDKPFQSGKLLCVNCPDIAAESIFFSSHVSLFTLPQIHGCNPQVILMSHCTTLWDVTWLCRFSLPLHRCGSGSCCYEQQRIFALRHGKFQHESCIIRIKNTVAKISKGGRHESNGSFFRTEVIYTIPLCWKQELCDESSEQKNSMPWLHMVNEKWKQFLKSFKQTKQWHPIKRQG